MLPYSLDALFSIVADLNTSHWYAVMACLAAGGVILAATVLPVIRPLDRVSGQLLAVGWIAVGGLFYGVHLAPFFFAAPWFQWVFIAQGVLLGAFAFSGAAALRRDVGPTTWLGRALMLYGLLGLPVLDLLLGSGWPAFRVVGLSPEPTVVFTCGWLLTRRPGTLVPALAFVPLLAGGAAGYAAMALAWWPDWGVAVAAAAGFAGSLVAVVRYVPR
ncbi:DUF6064 family protein [Aquisalimonas asiatica]|uniref:Uncharacterized protein n=1 Tax=Aquisalimonas asiatica TaxID=406100 RepID=A0A1H8RWY4_9GAMM|nr:DUF6064 family protein [Aquisalimonas asiatica]SEO70875.1 hypothetical protein SAMN04488052_102310 [Aquisalimonas asiatica]